MVKKYETKEQINDVMSLLEKIMNKTEYTDKALYNVVSKEWDKLYEYKRLGNGKKLPDYKEE